MLDQPPLTEAKRGVLGLLKRLGPATASVIAEQSGITAVAVRQHLGSLEAAGLVRSEAQPPAGRGRPSIRWSLTDDAVGLFPDEHAELAVGLLEAIRKASGEKGLDRVIACRAERQVEQYRDLMPAGASLKKRVETLARQRTAEGYMAEVVQERPGEYVLVERHCPICDAARACRGLCQAELNVFRKTLGPGVEIERTKHLLTDSDRCAYRIRKKRA